MREILFRAKTVNENEWIYGDIYHRGACPEIMRIHDYKNRVNYAVNPETLGQYTGLMDKNGVRIFEGDLIRTAGNLERLFVVCWSDKSLQFVKKDAHLDDGAEYGIPNIKIFLYEIVGNVYDNPELVEREGIE